jgi:tetrahydromethanopterin S-methyltransferase subunit B
MATPKKNSFITYDLQWLEKKINELKKYVDDRPFDRLKDRTDSMGKVISKIEDQIKTLKDILKDLPAMLDALDKLREKEEKKLGPIRGDQTLSPFESGEI